MRPGRDPFPKHALFDRREQVALAKTRPVPVEQPRAKTMKRADEQLAHGQLDAGALAQTQDDAIKHLLRGAAGESEHENGARIDAIVDCQRGETASKRLRLACAWPSQDQEMAAAMIDDRTLLRGRFERLHALIPLASKQRISS